MQPKISAFFERQETDPDPIRFFSLSLFELITLIPNPPDLNIFVELLWCLMQEHEGRIR
ncbi:N-acetyltransferase ESCO1 [Zea mays]|jgi:hypothetical protein|uniref:N-acetyltransferase ESCO1 n=1 Tax=Zea mays TaxID=4577 RepID=A0A1D6E724_MAIZE|nr:N-acetyltransferase ESCO1 [Zea mays]ONM16235.1 N-acetyltransferase ESCO1 [Zea mays]